MLFEEFIIDCRERAVKGFLDLVILHLLSKRAMSGYEINKALIKRFGLIIGPSTIYSKLSTLEKQGLLTCEACRSGKIYSVTQEGREIEVQKEAVINEAYGYLIGKLKRS
jgi:DNA-binding PadR family transcriptional regulator